MTSCVPKELRTLVVRQSSGEHRLYIDLETIPPDIWQQIQIAVEEYRVLSGHLPLGVVLDEPARGLITAYGKMVEEKQPREAGVAECEELLRRMREGEE